MMEDMTKTVYPMSPRSAVLFNASVGHEILVIFHLILYLSL